jgi:hypothetical protein
MAYQCPRYFREGFCREPSTTIDIKQPLGFLIPNNSMYTDKQKKPLPCGNDSLGA